MQLYLQFGQHLFRQDSALIGALLVRSQWIIGLNQVDYSGVTITMRLLFSACLLFTNVLHPLQPVAKSGIPQLAGEAFWSWFDDYEVKGAAHK